MRVAAALLIAVLAPSLCAAQDLTPRAYLLLPVESNAVIVTYAFSDGELLFDPTVPIEDAVGTIHAPVAVLLLRLRFLRPLREHHRLGPIPHR